MYLVKLFFKNKIDCSELLPFYEYLTLQCGSTKCSPTQYAPFSSILCTLHTQYAPLEHFVYPAYTICYQRSILCRVGTYVISVVVRGYTICSS